MGAHLIDHPVWGLDLGLPTSIETTSTPFDGICYPVATSTHYVFPARNGKPAAVLISPEDLGLMHRTDSVDDAFNYLTSRLTQLVLRREGDKKPQPS